MASTSTLAMDQIYAEVLGDTRDFPLRRYAREKIQSREIGDMIGRPVSPPRIGDGAFEWRRSHTVSGNPVRFDAGPAVLRLDDEWTNSMSRAGRLAVATLSFPLLVRYGYMRLFQHTPAL